MSYTVTDLDALAGPVRRIALELADDLPRYLLPVIGALLGLFHVEPRVLAIYGEAGPLVRRFALTTWRSRFERAGYASPKAILDALRLCLAVRLLDDGWTVQRVAYDMGCSSPQAFTRWFRHLTGRTPMTRGTLDTDAILRSAMTPQLALALVGAA